jgi:uncharacterized protein (DUF302 family)
MSTEVKMKASRVDETRYGLRVELQASYETAIERITAELKKQGFGVLTTIDVRETLRKKLDREFRRYAILGACNPELAHRALQAELEVGLLLPCNVIVYEVEPGRTVVAAMAPLAALSIIASGSVADVAKEADRRLRAALESVGASGAPN